MTSNRALDCNEIVREENREMLRKWEINQKTKERIKIVWTRIWRRFSSPALSSSSESRVTSNRVLDCNEIVGEENREMLRKWEINLKTKEGIKIVRTRIWRRFLSLALSSSSESKVTSNRALDCNEIVREENREMRRKWEINPRRNKNSSNSSMSRIFVPRVIVIEWIESNIERGVWLQLENKRKWTKSWEKKIEGESEKLIREETAKEGIKIVRTLIWQGFSSPAFRSRYHNFELSNEYEKERFIYIYISFNFISTRCFLFTIQGKIGKTKLCTAAA